MLRSGFILGVSAPAALMALLAQPLVRDGADLISVRSQTTFVDRGAAWEQNLNSLAVSRGAILHTASVVVPVRRTNRGAETTAPAKQDKASTKLPRRLMREGCEAAISSLAGPEARRMVPGRCIA